LPNKGAFISEAFLQPFKGRLTKKLMKQCDINFLTLERNKNLPFSCAQSQYEFLYDGTSIKVLDKLTAYQLWRYVFDVEFLQDLKLPAAIAACAGKINGNQCGNDINMQLCTGTQSNGYFVSVRSDNNDNVAFVLSGTGDKYLKETTVSRSVLRVPSCTSHFNNALRACENVVATCSQTSGSLKKCRSGQTRAFILREPAYKGGRITIQWREPVDYLNTAWDFESKVVNTEQVGASECKVGMDYDYSGICGGLVDRCSSLTQTKRCSVNDFYITRLAYNPNENGTGGQIVVTRPDNSHVLIKRNKIGAKSCKSDNYHFIRAFDSCEGSVASLQNSCQKSGKDWTSCNNPAYQYTIAGQNSRLQKFGEIQIKTPSGASKRVSRQQLGLSVCIDDEAHFQNAIRACELSVASLNNTCSNTGKSWAQCGNSPYQYAIAAFDAEQVGDFKGGEIQIKIPSGETRIIARNRLGAQACLNNEAHFEQAIQDCNGNFSNLNQDSCTNEGVDWQSCGNSSYQYAIEPYRAQGNGSGGRVKLKTPNGAIKTLSRVLYQRQLVLVTINILRVPLHLAGQKFKH
jgi:hypothetical protein